MSSSICADTWRVPIRVICLYFFFFFFFVLFLFLCFFFYNSYKFFFHQWHLCDGRPRISRISKSQEHFCHRTLRRNGIVSYRNNTISPQDLQRAGEFCARNSPARPMMQLMRKLGGIYQSG
jgi:hypothetical protein